MYVYTGHRTCTPGVLCSSVVRKIATHHIIRNATASTPRGAGRVAVGWVASGMPLPTSLTASPDTSHNDERTLARFSRPHATEHGPRHTHSDKDQQPAPPPGASAHGHRHLRHTHHVTRLSADTGMDTAHGAAFGVPMVYDQLRVDVISQHARSLNTSGEFRSTQELVRGLRRRPMDGTPAVAPRTAPPASSTPRQPSLISTDYPRLRVRCTLRT